MDPGYNCYNNLEYGLSLSFKMCQQLWRNGSSLAFLFDCKGMKNPPCTQLWISEIRNNVTNTSFADCQLLGSDMSKHVNRIDIGSTTIPNIH
jgi:hypothetical protein